LAHEQAAAHAGSQVDSSELLNREQELLARQTELEQRVAELTRQQTELAAAQDDLATQRETTRQEAEQARRELIADRRLLAEDRQALMAELDGQRAELERQRTRFAQETDFADEAHRLPQQFAAQQVSSAVDEVVEDQSDESVVDPVGADADDDEDILEAMRRQARERMRAARRDTEEAEDAEEAPAERPVGRRGPSRVVDTTGEDDSIEDHIAAWLNKRCAAAPPVPPPAEPKHRQRKSDPKPEPVVESAAPSAEPTIVRRPPPETVPVIDMAPTLTELVRRAQPAETGNYAAMRELGNTYAHISITSYDKKLTLRRSIVAGLLALVCIFGALLVWAIVPEGNILGMLGMVAMVAGIYWGLCALVALQKWLLTARGKKFRDLWRMLWSETKGPQGK
jgi:hypothetical protein